MLATGTVTALQLINLGTGYRYTLQNGDVISLSDPAWSAASFNIEALVSTTSGPVRGPRAAPGTRQAKDKASPSSSRAVLGRGVKYPCHAKKAVPPSNDTPADVEGATVANRAVRDAGKKSRCGGGPEGDDDYDNDVQHC